MKLFLALLLFAQFSFGASTKVPYAGLNISGKIVSGDISPSAAIPFSKLDSSNIDANLTFNTGSTVIIETKDDSAATQNATVKTGDTSGTDGTGDLLLKSGNGGFGSQWTGDSKLETGDSPGGYTGGAYVHTGDTSAPADSGPIVLDSGVGYNTGDFSAATGNAAINSGNLSLTAGTAGTLRGQISLNARQIDVNSTKIVNLLDPTSDQDAATKKYVDDNAGGGPVTTVEIVDGTITSADISTGAITTIKILDGTVGSADLTDAAVTSVKILDGTIVSGDISGTAGILGSQLSAAAAIVSGQILDATITSADISATAAIPYSKLVLSNSLVSGDLTTGAVTTAKILDGTITSADLTTSITLTTPVISGDLTLTDGNLVVATGKGINFAADSNASGMTGELLSDYEQGTFTPVIYGTGSAGTGTYISQGGFYTKVGRMVQILIYLNWSNHTGTTNMNISGLPFTAAGGLAYAGLAGTNANISMTAGNFMVAYVNAGATTIELNQAPTGGGATVGIPIDTSAVIIISGSYIL